MIVLGTFKMAMTLLDTGSVLQLPMMEQSGEPAEPAQAPAPAESTARPAAPAPLMISPTPVEKQSNNSSAPNTLDSARIAVPPQAAPQPPAASDITGAITTMPATGGKLAMIAVPPTERLPDGIGGPVLRAAALKGDPAAAYEVGVRFAEGKGIAPDLDQAAKWYDRAAQAGVVPAIFRLGTFYEKGLSVKKDVDIARRYYAQAAERGSAKAMHNLAVLDADGGGKGANYKSASHWFRKAADRGVADSQFNLGILYARGIGVEQNLAESFKWFSLAAGPGRRGCGPQARRYRQAPRRPVAGGGQARDPDLYAGAAARRRRQRGGTRRWLGFCSRAGHGQARRQAGCVQAHRRRELRFRKSRPCRWHGHLPDHKWV